MLSFLAAESPLVSKEWTSSHWSSFNKSQSRKVGWFCISGKQIVALPNHRKLQIVKENSPWAARGDWNLERLKRRFCSKRGSRTDSCWLFGSKLAEIRWRQSDITMKWDYIHRFSCRNICEKSFLCYTYRKDEYSSEWILTTVLSIIRTLIVLPTWLNMCEDTMRAS